MQLSIEDLNLCKVLEGVKRNGSVKLACDEIGISASQGSRLISNKEKELNVNLVETIPFTGSKVTFSGDRLIRLTHKAIKYLNYLNKKHL